MTTLDPILYASIADIVLGGAALAVAGVKAVNAITGPVCTACLAGCHDELAAITEGQMRCICKCHGGRG